MAEAFKNRFLQRPFIHALADALVDVWPAFDRQAFVSRVYADPWDRLELKGRMRHVSEALGASLPPSFPEALALVMRVEGLSSGFDHLVFADFVERFGVDHYELSMASLGILTRSSAEFAVRPFLRRYPEQALAQMRAWAAGGTEHQRRLASEGCRPRLPWGTALTELKADPAPIFPILEALKDDPSEYVRRSVANNLGDIAKDHPDAAVEIGKRWITESASRTPLVKHALRDLLKKGHRGALALFGVAKGLKVEVVDCGLSPARLPIGQAATLTVTLRSTSRQNQAIRLDYAITYARPGERSGRKVFRLADATLVPGKDLTYSRTVSFADRSIRTHHPGIHTVTLLGNGRVLSETRVTLVRARSSRA